MRKRHSTASKLAGLLPLLVTACSASFAGAAAPPESINLRRTVTVDVVERTKNAVVYISTTKFVPERVSMFGGGDPMFQRFGPGQIVQRESGSLGSGFIVHPDGYVVTNNHVIDGARQINVELLDGRKLPADIVSADTEADLAILKIKSDKPLPALALGDSADLMIGEPTIAVGNPLGFSHSVSTGIVSAVHRDLVAAADPQHRGEVAAEDENSPLRDLVQTDAAINPGNSGGPLLNAYGQVIGINTAVRGDAQNIGFAIPVNRLREMIPTLMNPAQVNKVTVPIKLRERREVAPPATITSTVELLDDRDDAPTTQHDHHDVAEINGVRPADIVDAYVQLLKVKAGDDVTLKVSGQNDAKVVKTTAAPQPDAVVQARKRLGLTVEPVTPMMSQRLSLRTEAGMFVTEVGKDSISAHAGIEPGDVIVKLGPYPVRSLEDLSSLMAAMPEKGKVRVTILRGNRLGSGVLEL